MSIKVVKGKSRDWRPYRFPPLPEALAPEWKNDPIALQRAIADGFQEGNEKGYLEGLAQGEEHGRQQGYDAGREQGFKEGLEQGRQQGRESFDLASAPLEAINRQLQSFLAAFENSRRQELLALVKKVAEQVIRCELTLNPTQLLTLAEEALRVNGVIEQLNQRQGHVREQIGRHESKDEKRWAHDFAGRVFEGEAGQGSDYLKVAQLVQCQANVSRHRVVGLMG